MRGLEDFDGEKYLTKCIRREARIDRRKWLEDTLADGSWMAVKRLRHKPQAKHASIQDLEGNLTGTAERPETLADYFEKIQWQIQFADVLPAAADPIGSELPIDTSDLKLAELKEALARLKAGKAAGPDDVPPDFWKAARNNEDACESLLNLCQRCWKEKDLPATWRKASVVLLFKKGDATPPSK